LIVGGIPSDFSIYGSDFSIYALGALGLIFSQDEFEFKQTPTRAGFAA